MKKVYCFLLFLGLISLSCNKEKRETQSIFLAGQIINPSSRNVTLYGGNRTVETFGLDDQLRFQKTFDSLPNGIYKLEHLPEYHDILKDTFDLDTIFVSFHRSNARPWKASNFNK